MKIFLIGMPGSGKTTLGRELAANLALDFVDLDEEIERAEAQSIPEIFSRHGQDHFRLVESRLLNEWAASAKSFVMATGGGAPCFYKGMDVINSHGISIFLDCPVDTLLDRVKRNQERPLLSGKDEAALRSKLEAILAERRECYNKAGVALRNPTFHTLLQAVHARK